MPTANGPTEGVNERYAMLLTMAEMQDAHNMLVHEQWRTRLRVLPRDVGRVR